MPHLMFIVEVIQLSCLTVETSWYPCATDLGQLLTSSERTSWSPTRPVPLARWGIGQRVPVCRDGLRVVDSACTVSSWTMGCVSLEERLCAEDSYSSGTKGRCWDSNCTEGGSLKEVSQDSRSDNQQLVFFSRLGQ